MSLPTQSEPRPPARRLGFHLYALHLWTIFGIALSNLLLGLGLVAAGGTLVRERSAIRRLAPVAMPLGLYVLFLAASIAASYEPAASLSAGRETFSLATLPLALLFVRDRDRMRRVVDGLVVVAALIAVYGLVEIPLGNGWTAERIRGPFSHYMTFAGVLLLADLMLVAQLASGAWRQWWRWAALAAINAALVGSLTRNAWVALAVAVTVLVLMRAPRWLLAYVPAAALFVALAPAPVVARAVSIFDLRHPTNYDRLCMLDAGLTMIGERPLFGLGPGMVEARYPIYRHPTAPRQSVPHLHNTVLQMAAERGLLSAAAFVWLLGGALVLAYRGSRGRGDGAAADLHLGAFLGLLAFALAGLFEDNWGDSEVRRVALFLMAIPYALKPARRPGS